MQSADQFYIDRDLSGRRQVFRHSHAWRPPTDLCETEEAIVANIEIAGMREGQISVSISDKLLSVTGVRSGTAPKGAYHQMEIQYGEFLTEVRLPTSVDEEQIEASYADGFLTITMPKRKAFRVPVR